MDLNSIGKTLFSDIYIKNDSLLHKYNELQENLFEEIKEKCKPKNNPFNPFEDTYNEKITEGMYLYMDAYSKIHPDAKYLRKSENELMIIDGNKKILVHFDDDGKVEYTEVTKEDGDYELSAGKYGKTKDEATQKIMTLYKDHGKTPELVGDTVVVNKDDYQLQYKVEGNGEVKRVVTALKIKDCIGNNIPIKLKEEQDKNKNAL